MFNCDRYITRGANCEIDGLTQIYMWKMIDDLEVEKDYLQVFHLSIAEKDGSQMQKIVHEQEQPEYKKEYVIPAANPVNTTVYVIDDEDHSTMLLSSEY
jgi:Staphylococcal protein of unknown function (DUF960).